MTHKELEAKWDSLTAQQKNGLVAVRVMGWTQLDKHPGPSRPIGILNPWTGEVTLPYGGPWFYPPGCPLEGNGAALPDYVGDIAWAWEVVEHMRSHGWTMTLSVNEYGTWDCRLFLYEWVMTRGATAPEAICKAALLAVEKEEVSRNGEDSGQ